MEHNRAGQPFTAKETEVEEVEQDKHIKEKMIKKKIDLLSFYVPSMWLINATNSLLIKLFLHKTRTSRKVSYVKGFIPLFSDSSRPGLQLVHIFPNQRKCYLNLDYSD